MKVVRSRADLTETLSEIAKQYGVALDDLMRLNGIGNADHIFVGQRLRLPGGAIRYSWWTPLTSAGVNISKAAFP